ncbi:MAG: phosphoglucomutase (alpha-D-glucose-1,6-bisphosphate-dependent) [Bradymonadales bacterium]|jgi:phosphoglucomutase
MLHELAGKPATPSMLVNIPRLISAYYTGEVDIQVPSQRVSFGTSGHRGVSLKQSFNEAHILAISQAVCDYRRAHGVGGPLFLGMDSHALSEPALVSALEVLAANGVRVVIQEGLGYTATPLISHAILNYNRTIKDSTKLSDGIVITPSHNPPEYGGFKYNPTTGGPADTDVTTEIETAANRYLEQKLKGVRRVSLGLGLKHEMIQRIDFVSAYVAELVQIIDMEAIAGSGLKLGVNPLGGATLDVWSAIADRYNLNLEITAPYIDHTFSFMTLDHDGKIRMDCSSPHAMASLIALRDRFDLAFGNDPDGDRHGVVTPSGLMNPNHYLAVMIEYLFESRKQWPQELMVGKTLVSSALIDRVAESLGRKVYEVPVGFKWFVDGLFNKRLGFGGEESAGASFLRLDASVWATDKDGIIPCLLAAEMQAKTAFGPLQRHERQIARFGKPAYARLERAANAQTRKALGSLRPEQIKSSMVGGEAIESILTKAAGNSAAIGGLKIVTKNGWFAVRPSGTEDIYKIYAESFIDESHLTQIEEDASEIVNSLI